MTETKKRVKVSVLILAILMFGMTAFSQQVKSENLEQKGPRVKVSVYSENSQSVRVRFFNAHGDLVSEQNLKPQDHIFFSVDQSVCREPVEAWVDGRYFTALRGNLCPENYPDEAKTILVSKSLPPQIIGEDRD